MIDENLLINKMYKIKNKLINSNKVLASNKAYFVEKIIEIVKSEPKIGEWIPVEERLPDKPGSYRVTCLYADKWYRVKDDLFYSDKTWGYDNIHRERKVIAWKEIEEPFKGETE